MYRVRRTVVRIKNQLVHLAFASGVIPNNDIVLPFVFCLAKHVEITRLRATEPPSRFVCFSLGRSFWTRKQACNRRAVARKSEMVVSPDRRMVPHLRRNDLGYVALSFSDRFGVRKNRFERKRLVVRGAQQHEPERICQCVSLRSQQRLDLLLKELINAGTDNDRPRRHLPTGLNNYF